MAITGKQLRGMLKEAKSGRIYKNKLKELLGISYDPILDRQTYDPKKRQLGTDEFSVRALTEEFCGHQFISELHSGGMSSNTVRTLKKASDEKALFEDVVGVDPSAMQDINAWTATISGLVEVKLLEAYNSPEFITDELVTIQPRRTNGGKMIGVPYVAPKSARVVSPGIEFPDAGLSQLWIWSRPNMTVGTKLGLDRETVVYDLSGELMGSAETVGKSLKWIQEYIRFAGIYGLNRVVSNEVDLSVTSQVGDSFRMNQTADSTPNPTYQSVGVTTNPNLTNAYNYVNLTTNTPIVDWTKIRVFRNLLNNMRDPVNNLPFDTEIEQILVDPFYAPDLQYVLHASQVWRFTGAAAAAPYQGSPTVNAPFATISPNAPEGSNLFNWSPHWSNIAHKVLTDAGVSDANANLYVVAGSLKKAFVWQQAWDMRVDQANPTDADMLARNIVNLWVAQWSGQMVIREPRYAVLATN